jgi:hypothetical protein
VLCAVGSGATIAEEPARQSQNELNLAPKKLDPESPVPADGRHAQAHQKYAMPATDRLMFKRIEDFKPVASEEENPLEYEAWGEFVRQAAKFPTSELERHGVRDLTVIDLLKQYRTYYRCELLRFDGKLVCVRRLKAPLSFQNNPESKVKELYEARFVPLDESPLTPMSVVFLDLPESLSAVREKPYREWLDAGAWVSAAGYYFKTMSVPDDRGGPVNVPVLVGRSITPLPGLPAPPGGDPTALEPVRLFKFIRDDAPVIRNAPGDADWPELAAQNRVLIHASRFGAEELERHATADVKFADLFEPVRAAFKLRNVRMEGRLISLRKADPSPELRAAGIDAVYEGWLVPANEPRGNPVCLQFTEPLEGLENPPKDGRVNRWVSFAGYSFKLMRYESAEQYEDPAKGYKVKRAPLLIGKSPVARRDPDAAVPLRSGALAQAAMVGGVLLIAGAGGLAWWYRRGDRRSKAAAARNPFEAGAAPPARTDF